MSYFENIEGPKLDTIFSRLAAEKTFVKVSMAHNPYESLTVVTLTQQESAQHIFHIDPPNGLIDAVKETNASLLHFEFTSEDGVSHHFDSEIKSTTPKDICLYFPPFLQRYQQRDNFRVSVIFDSFAKLLIDETELKLGIENISLGGVYCHCLTKYKSKFAESQVFKGLELYITMPNECYKVPVEKAKVNRIESIPQPKHFGIAFEFVRLKREAKKVLVQQIYELQRQRLQNRIKGLE